jgi:hypothetical protein
MIVRMSVSIAGLWATPARHARPCAGHPRQAAIANFEGSCNGAAWMAGTSPAMT